MGRNAFVALLALSVLIATACAPSREGPSGQDAQILPLVDGPKGGDTKIMPLVDGPMVSTDTSPCPVCDDGDPCTDDVCEAGGLCRYVPKNCDDSDPCTVDGCSAGQCTHEKGGQAVYRHVHTTISSHAYSLSATPPLGFRMESIVWRTFAAAGADRRLIYQNRRDASTDRMLTTNEQDGIACCGYVRDGDIGYAYSKKSGSLIAVYRLFNTSLGLHLSSTSNTEGTPAYHLESLQFYACPR